MSEKKKKGMETDRAERISATNNMATMRTQVIPNKKKYSKSKRKKDKNQGFED